MAEYPPYMNAYGLITKILNKMKEARTPPRFTVDFLGTNLGFSGGSARPFIGFAKRLGLISSDGTPTEIYHSFRNPDHTKGAMARAIRTGYAQLYDRNEHAHKLDRSGLEGLIVQVTGLDKGSSIIRSVISSFEALKPFAEFDAVEPKKRETKSKSEPEPSREELTESESPKLNLAYTINLNLPKTDDIAVFNAIFKALKENLLRK